MTQPAVPAPLNKRWRYHFLGIGGVGMSALAQVLHRRGYRISGSDIHDSESLRALSSAGIGVCVGHSAAALLEADAVVYTSAVPAAHPIWADVTRLGLPRFHRAQALGALSRGQRAAAVTGTHGKTTTSACLAFTLRQAGCDPTALIGGHVPQLDGANFTVGDGPWMVLEADESDGSFLQFAPDALLITNIEDDHLEHHGTQEKLQAAFADFAALLPPHGPLVACRDDVQATRLATAHGGRVISYGRHAQADVRVEPLPRRAQGADLQRVVLHHAGGRYETALRIPGLHNAVNLAGVFALATAIGLPPLDALAGLQAFQGVARRQQFIGQRGGLRIFDDYAHHPTEIRATLAAFAAATGGPITVVFQPHLYSRTARLAGEFAEALRPAARVIVTDVYAAREAPQPGVSGRLIVERLAGHPSAEFAASWREASERLLRDPPRGVLLTMGAGDITNMGPYLLRAMGRVLEPRHE
ncbi:MAG: UDP-N-acetylmuramate--L-alanine ligase [Candidatus Lambdaproteobacteria bacterium]|nr:UDP-N-acetylmuramate--L-alanine ligase [Candidatus Lambdaproteobacteria bacterium]